jgi:competence protein ComEC
MMEREHPLLIPFVALSAGLVISDLTGFLLPVSAIPAIFISLLLALFVRSRFEFNLVTALFCLFWGMYALKPWIAPEQSSVSIVEHAGRTPVIIEGVVSSRPVTKTTQAGLTGSLVLQVEHVFKDKKPLPVTGSMQILFSKGEAAFTRGDRIRLSSRVSLPKRLGLPGEFDYLRYLAYRGVAATGRVDSSEDVVLIRSGAVDSVPRRADLLAARLGEYIRTSIQDQGVASIVSALLIGDQKRIPAELNDAYTRAGVNHILSISGFHIGIIAYFIIQLGLLLATRSEYAALYLNLRRVVLLLALPVMLAYLFLTGTAPATARAVIMLSVFVAALYLERESNPFNTLLLSAMLLVVINPPTLFDISFQLSFIAIWGITLFIPPLMERFGEFSCDWKRQLTQFTLTSVAAVAVTAVPVLFWFNQTSLNGILTNFILVPLLGYGAVLTGFLSLPFVYLAPSVADLLLWLTARIVMLSNWLIDRFAALPVVSYYNITATDMLLMLALMTVLTFVKLRSARILLGAGLPAIAVIIHLAGAPQGDGRLHVTMLSVGQGESILLRLPDGGNMLVDGGGYLHDNGLDFGERLLVPALRKLGIEKIDRMVMTHSHPDHIGGLPSAAARFQVGEFYQPSTGGFGSDYKKLRHNLHLQGTPLKSLSSGDRLTLAEGVTMTVHSPGGNSNLTAENTSDEIELNEESLVFSIRYGSVSMLFTADAGFPAENRMMADNRELGAAILKVGHHGSRYSTSDDFLAKVKPQVALISAGAGNSFGLPASDTISQLEKRGIATYRTDKDGTIDLIIDGTGWKVETNFVSAR